MIDGIKIAFYYREFYKVLQSLGAKVLTPLEEATGELHYPKVAKFKNLTFELHASGRVEIRGSLHKYLKGENYSDFTYPELRQCVTDLFSKFQIPLNARISNLEFGVNVITPFSPFEFLRNVLAYKNDNFNQFADKGKGIESGFQCVNQRYTLKMYDKGAQYRYYVNGHFLRYEIRVTKMVHLKEAGISFLTDLTDLNKLQKLAGMIDETYNGILINDIVDTTLLTRNQERIYLECSNPRSWHKLNYTPGKRIKRKRLLTEILQQYGQLKLKELAGRLIAEKLQVLLSEPAKSGNDLTDLKTIQGERFNRLDNRLNHNPLKNILRHLWKRHGTSKIREQIK